MEYSPVFLKARALAFSLLSFISFVWSVLLCVILVVQFDHMYRAEKSFISVMLVLDVITVFIPLILLILPFRPWLDGARCIFLLVAHITAAALFASWSTRFQCPVRDGDQEGICELLIVYMAIASWVIPVLVLIYSGGLLLMVHRRSKMEKAQDNQAFPVDIEKRLSDSSTSSGAGSHDSFFPAKHESKLFDPAKMIAPPPPARRTSERVSDRISSNYSSVTRPNSGRQSYSTRSSTTQPRISQPMMMPPTRMHPPSSFPRPPRLTVAIPPARMSYQPPTIVQSHSPIYPTRPARQSTLAKSPKYNFMTH